MKRLTIEEVHIHKIEELGLDPNAVDLTSSEAIAGALRRAASFLCPCSSSTLIRAVVQPLRGLVDDLDNVKVSVQSILEALIAHGDIMEQIEARDDNMGYKIGTLLYVAPPSFVVRQSGTAIILGISSDQLSALPDDWETRIEYINHVRRLTPLTGEDLRLELKQLGLIEITYTKWIKQPSIEEPCQFIYRMNQLLDSASPAIEIPGLSLLETSRPVRYYRGRWVESTNQTGRFVGRRAQAYGADLWCYVELDRGTPIKFLDLPLEKGYWRGCDEAWRLQAAIDYERGVPQNFRTRQGSCDKLIFDFFSPIPMWAIRRWDAVGEPVVPSRCLFSYKFGKQEIAEEVRFINEELWLIENSI